MSYEQLEEPLEALRDKGLLRCQGKISFPLLTDHSNRYKIRKWADRRNILHAYRQTKGRDPWYILKSSQYSYSEWWRVKAQ